VWPLRLDQFDPIAKWITGENPLDTGTGFGIQGDFVAGPLERFAHGPQVMHEERRVGFFRRAEFGFDAGMELKRATPEP